MEAFNFESLTGDVVTKDSPIYEQSILSWNRAIKKKPLVIVFCENKEDILNAIRWSRENSIEFRIRSGRHHYAGYSTGDNVLVMDVSKMNEIVVNQENNIVKIGAGVRNRELYEALNSKGYPFPGGGCPTVGVVGYALGGGWGYSARLLGLGCDALIEAEILNYKGEIIVANDKENSDLLWALKGCGGGNFGVVLSMTFKLPTKIKNTTLIRLDYKNLKLDEKIDIFELVQREFKIIDERLNVKVAFYNSKENGKGVFVIGLFYGTKEEAENVLKPLTDNKNITEISLRYMSVLEANRDIQDSHPDYETYKSGGRFVKRDYSREEIKELVDIVSSRAEGSIYTAVSLYGLGGKISKIKNEESAFAFRDASFAMGFQTLWEDDNYEKVNKEWFSNNFKIIKALTQGSFINFPLAEIDNYQEEYYGANLQKLRKIKQKYDANNCFNFPQSIR